MVGQTCLNPFMNQVYFYLDAPSHGGRAALPCLNPFMNQVYFYVRQKGF